VFLVVALMLFVLLLFSVLGNVVVGMGDDIGDVVVL